MRKLVILFSVLFFSFNLLFAQSVKIQIGSEVIETEIVANTGNEIYTKNGNFLIKDVDVITFKNYDDTKLPFYNNLIQQTKVLFEDGTEITNQNIDGAIEKYNSKLIKSSGDYLIDAGTEAMIGVFIPIAAAIATSSLDAPPAVLIIGGVVGLTLQISAWNKVIKAGKAMKLEKK
jgi:hypothetical protein